MVWNLLDWAGATQHARHVEKAVVQEAPFTVDSMVSLLLTMGSDLLVRLGHRESRLVGFEDMYDRIDSRKLSGVSWRCGRMSLECRQTLAQLQMDSDRELSSECHFHIMITQALVHNTAVYRKYCAAQPADFGAWFSESFPELIGF